MRQFLLICGQSLSWWEMQHQNSQYAGLLQHFDGYLILLHYFFFDVNLFCFIINSDLRIHARTKLASSSVIFLETCSYAMNKFVTAISNIF